MSTAERFPLHDWSRVPPGHDDTRDWQCGRCKLYAAIAIRGVDKDGLRVLERHALAGRCWTPALGNWNNDGSMSVEEINNANETFTVVPKGDTDDPSAIRVLPWSEYPAFMGIKGPPT